MEARSACKVNSEIHYLCYSLSLISCLLCKGLMIRIQPWSISLKEVLWHSNSWPCWFGWVLSPCVHKYKQNRYYMECILQYLVWVSVVSIHWIVATCLLIYTKIQLFGFLLKSVHIHDVLYDDFICNIVYSLMS